MTDVIERTLWRLRAQMPGRLSRPGDHRYSVATAIWAKPAGPIPLAVVRCRTRDEVQIVIRAARDCDLPLSVRGGGHDWAGRALCGGIVIDLSDMKGVTVTANNTAYISGGARTSDVVAKTDPLGLAPVTGMCGAVGMAGLTLGGGYGSLIGRFGLALDNVDFAEIVLADGRTVVADVDREPELFWALRGGGGNFGVVTAMCHRVHHLPSVCSGVLIYPFSEAKTVLEACAEIAASARDELSIQVAFVAGPDGTPIVMLMPTWSGLAREGEARIVPLLRLGTLLDNTVGAVSFGTSLAAFDTHITNGQRVFAETSWLPPLDRHSIDIFIRAMETAISPGCAIITHEFKGAASRVPIKDTAFGLRRDHLSVEILASFTDQSDKIDGLAHQRWVQSTRKALDSIAFPGGYPNFLAPGDTDRAAKSFGRNAERLLNAKRHYDPDNVFSSAIPLPSA